ncbi:MAG TPA: hypothetical protein PLU55_00165 [Candidatus Pacearchaeota archaeon]|nr:hypothetical protein [Candidatus Pacearchaeota archaeon]
MKKRGAILVENVVFLILNLLFLSILVLFLVKQGSGATVLEEAYSKQIAMVINSAKPGMVIRLDMDKGRKIAEEKGFDFGNSVIIENNVVYVQLTPDGRYSYAFFNNVDVSSRALKDEKGKYSGTYLFTVKPKGGNLNG